MRKVALLSRIAAGTSLKRLLIKTISNFFRMYNAGKDRKEKQKEDRDKIEDEKAGRDKIEDEKADRDKIEDKKEDRDKKENKKEDREQNTENN